MADVGNERKPGSAALENMKLLKNESNLFKVPKLPKHKKTKTKKSLVLDEELYVKGIAKIIQRDFFPDLEKLNAQNEYLEATDSKDYERLREITKKYNSTNGLVRPPTEPYASPATFDTPSNERAQSPSAPAGHHRPPPPDSRETKYSDITDNHSLDSFLAKHTSEDNASYDRVIALEDKKLFNKVADQFESEHTSAALADAAMVLPSIELQADQSERPHELDTWRYKAKNYIMYVPDGGSSQGAPPKPELLHHNTRLRADPFDHARNKETISAIARTQDATITGRIGVDGVSMGSEKGQDGQYSLVASPSPRPGDGPDQSPLMTWGEIEGTPFRLDGGDTPLPAVGAGVAYRMLEWGARERIGLQLAEQAARRRRPTTPRPVPHTPSFRTNTERLASMSPAARKLAAKHLLSPRLKLTPNNMGILSHVASPKRTPNPRRPLVATPNNNKKRATPTAASDNTEMSEKDNLTDNLLQINLAKRSRMTAQDFFK